LCGNVWRQDNDVNNNNNNNNNNVKCVIIPVVTGATGIVTKGLSKHLEATRGKHSTASLQTKATLGISHKIRKVLQCENGSLSGEDQ
jgi:sirohydrochlorin ferrochelatase